MRKEVRRIVGIWIALSIIFVLFAAVWSSRVALATGSTWKGLVDSLPAEGLRGEWVVSGRTFVADANTRFHDDRDDFDVGVCVEVAYSGEQEPYLAKKIAKKGSGDCPEPTREAYGLIEQTPRRGLLGDWQIDGVAYRALPGAQFKQRYGPLVVGACAKVQYTGAESPYRVRKLESRPQAECGESGTIPPVTPTPPPGETVERYGRIDSFPANLVGDWVVGDIAYVATDATQFKQQNGAFAVSACVKVVAYASTDPATLRKVETERSHKCGQDDDDDDEEDIIGRGELFGEVQSLPDGLLGEWNVAGITFLVDESTELKQRNGVFAVGAVVKVKFLIRANGDFYAREIELKSDVRPNKGHAFGLIDSLTAERVGVWTIGGIDYQVTAATRLREKHGLFEVGARVRVTYVVDENARRVATKIETTRSQGGVTNPTHLKAFGYVGQMPAEELVGAWTINEVVYIATAATVFEEEHGLLGLGAYVAVEYRIVEGRNVAHKIETKVPPGAGTQSILAVIEAKQEVAAAEVSDDEMWRIGGVDYLITPATDVDDLDSELEVGNTALVNSYAEADGTLVATEVRGVTMANSLYLPAVTR